MPESLVALRDRREQVIARLSDAYANDLLDVDELDRRLDLAHGARAVAELDALVADLAPAPASAAATALVPAAPHALDDLRLPRFSGQLSYAASASLRRSASASFGGL